MTDDAARLRDRPGMAEVEAATSRLQDRGYAFFRNGRVVSPDGHVITDEDRSDFDLVKAVYRHSQLV